MSTDRILTRDVRAQRRIIEIPMVHAWLSGTTLLAVMGGLTFGCIGMAAWNGHLRRLAVQESARVDSLAPVRASLERQAELAAIIGRVAPDADPRTSALVAREIHRNAQLYGFDPLVILAVVLTESGIDADATGRLQSGAASGAHGVMQVKRATARAMAAALGLSEPDQDDLADPAYNLSVGVAYLLQMVHRYQSLRLGIMAYNVGPGAVESGLRGEGSLPEGYYRKVLRTYWKLSQGRRERG